MPRRVVRHAVVQPADTSIRLIPLTQGQNAIVDADDYEFISKYDWYAQWSPCVNGFYAVRSTIAPNRKAIRIHREILGLSLGDKRQGDHINGNMLDNRKDNLRIATHHQNSHNTKKSCMNTSGYKGVSLYSKTNRWKAQHTVSGKPTHIGYFKSKEDAAQAYMLIIYINHGDFSRFS